MGRRETVVVAMSGGVDSTVTAALLCESGYEVVGVTMHLWDGAGTTGHDRQCCSLGAAEDARRAANRLGIPHYVVDMRQPFADSVVDPFVAAYVAGRTPNPCIDCNRWIKFRHLLAYARTIGADKIATGHYGRVVRHPDGTHYELRRARYLEKDQSYALYSLTQEQMARTLLPLGDMGSKAETRRLAADRGLHVASKPDSQDICFVPRAGYGAFVADRCPESAQRGDVVDTAGRVLGHHSGVVHYTIGQRRRLPASTGGPLYVKSIKPEDRRVVVSNLAALYERDFTVCGMHWSVRTPEPSEFPVAVSACIRYNAPVQPAVLRSGPSPDIVRCTFAEPQRAITPGQAAVFYHGDLVIGGGPIDQVGACI